MAKASSSASAPEFRACVECRKRKSKCSGAPPCSYCARNRKSCIFGRAPSRTPLTRRNLDEAQRRCVGLISLLQKLNPDLDIDEALDTVTRNPEMVSGYPHAMPHGGESDQESHLSSDRFEWNEASLASPSRIPKEAPDGMASLPTTRTESGYLGNSSGSSILRTISDLLQDHSNLQSTQQEHISPANVSQTGSPSLSAHLANTAVLDQLVDAYFMCYNTSFPILHESTFREKYQNRQQIHTRSSWHPIFYIVLAIGDWVLTDGSEAEQSRYYTAARSRMSMRMLESGTLLTVQAFLLMGNYLQKRDRPNTGYNFIGIAYRMALGLGLHREPASGTTADTLFNERQRVVWWIVYCFDSGFSLTTGRPIMASDSFIETRLPRNIDDSACTMDSLLPPPTERPTIYSAIIAQARLASIGNVVYNGLISVPNKRTFNLKTSRSIEYQFKAWKLSLPAYFTGQDVPKWFRGPRAIVGWKEQNLRMMLWWASQRLCTSSSDRDEAQNICHFAAVETIQDITTFCLDFPDTLHTGLSWYATYFLFQAAVVLNTRHLRPLQPGDTGLAPVDQELWIFSISRAHDCLANLGRTNKAATRCLAVLDRIKDQSQPPQAIPSSPATGSPANPPESMPLDAVSEEADIHSAPFAVDPSLQIFFENTSWDKDIFEGLHGFPSTDEVESFDYVPSNTVAANTGQGWLMPTDPSLEPS